MFIDHRQEQWPEWLGTAEFVYNNKVHSSTRTSFFKANYRQDPRIRFEGRKKGKRYVEQVEGQKREQPALVIIEGEKE